MIKDDICDVHDALSIIHDQLHPHQQEGVSMTPQELKDFLYLIHCLLKRTGRVKAHFMNNDFISEHDFQVGDNVVPFSKGIKTKTNTNTNGAA